MRIEYYSKLIAKYPILSIEDPLDEQDWDGWQKLTLEMGKKVQIVGDDIFVTNVERLKQVKRENYQDQNPEAVDNDENKKDFAEFDRFENQWINEVKKVFPKPKMFDVYIVFREDNEKEKMEAYEEFHKLMEKKFGPNYTYSLSEDQTKMEQKINDKYLKKLKDMVGVLS